MELEIWEKYVDRKKILILAVNQRRSYFNFIFPAAFLHLTKDLFFDLNQFFFFFVLYHARSYRIQAPFFHLFLCLILNQMTRFLFEIDLLLALMDSITLHTDELVEFSHSLIFSFNHMSLQPFISTIRWWRISLLSFLIFYDYTTK